MQSTLIIRCTRAILGTLLAVSLPLLAASMDAKLNMAKRLVDEVQSGLTALRPGDVSRYNALSAKLTKAADLLKTTESRAHPDYVPAIQKWGELQQTMAQTAQQWQANSASTAASANSAAPATNQSPSTRNGPATSNAASSEVDANQILAKYQRANRPRLPDNATPEQAGQWAKRMKALQTTELQADLAALNTPGVSAADRDRVSRWINGTFQSQISEDVRSQIGQTRSAITMALQLSEQIDAIPADDTMRAYNFAQGDNGKNNASTLQNGLRAATVAQALGSVYPELAISDVPVSVKTLATTQQRFSAMRSEAVTTGEALAKLPKKQRAKTPDFLAPIAQEFWLRGSVFASIDAKGNVWIGSTEVGDIESNGKIWVRGNQLGSIEPDGKVWFRGNSVGSLEPNGEVWRRGTQVGLVETNGKVWIDGNSNGEITPYQGEWKRAAILYYFRDFFADAL